MPGTLLLETIRVGDCGRPRRVIAQTRGRPRQVLLYELCMQSQIQDFPKEGARFRVKCHVDAIQWGGVVAEFFRDLLNPMRFSGGGVVAQIFP